MEEKNKEIVTEHIPVRFFKPEDVGPRDWGREVLVAHAHGKYIGKVLTIKAGHKGGLQKHRVKDETAYIVSGQLMFRYDNGDGKISERVINPGESVHIPPGAVHQEEAISDCVIFETSTPVFDDRIRMEEHYGQGIEGGLPTTDSPILC